MGRVRISVMLACRSVQHCLAHGEVDRQHSQQNTDETDENSVVPLTDSNIKQVCDCVLFEILSAEVGIMS